MTLLGYYETYLNTPSGAGSYRGELRVYLNRQDVLANTSVVGWEFGIRRLAGSGRFSNEPNYWGVTVNGSSVATGDLRYNFSDSVTNVGLGPQGAWIVVSSGEVTVAHGTDGVKGINAFASFNDTAVNLQAFSVGPGGATDITLTPIPRATTPTVSPNPVLEGNSVVISLPRANGAFTHDVTWASGALSGTIATGVGTSCTWVPAPWSAGALLWTNVYTNPGFETASGTVESRRNFLPNPRNQVNATGYSTAGTVVGGSAAARTAIADLPGFSWAYVRDLLAGTAANGYRLYRSITGLTIGATYTVGAWVGIDDANTWALRVSDSTAGTSPIAAVSGLTTATNTVGRWQWVTMTFVATATTTYLHVFKASGGTTASWMGLTGTILLLGSYPNFPAARYFDGYTAAAGDFTYGWSGAADTTASVELAPGVVNLSASVPASRMQSSEWAYAGTKSLRVRGGVGSADTYGSFSLLTVPGYAEGKTYTIVAMLRYAENVSAGTDAGANQGRNLFIDITGGGGGLRGFAWTAKSPAATPGVYEHRLTFTVPSVGGDPVTGLNLRLYKGQVMSQPDVWWDALTIVEVPNIGSPYTGPVFSGDTPNDPGPGVGYYWTGAANASTSTTRTLVPDGSIMAQWPGRPTAPITITVVTKNGATVIGTKTVTLMLRALPTPPPLGIEKFKFDIRLRRVEWISGVWKPTEVIPTLDMSFVDPHSATATCSVTMSDLVAEIPDYSVVDIEVQDGLTWTNPGLRFVLTRVQDDLTDKTGAVKYTGINFVDFILARGYTQRDDHKYNGATAGFIMRDLTAQAQARAWGPRFDRGFGNDLTAAADAWENKSITREVRAGIPLSQVLEGLVDDGLAEYRSRYQANKAYLDLYNPGTGSDWAVDGSNPVINLSMADLTRAPRRGTIEDRVTRVTVDGDADLRRTRERPAFDANVMGQLEGWVSASGVKDPGEADRMGDSALADAAVANNERTFEFSPHATPRHLWPYVYARPGDWVLIPKVDKSGTERARIGQITISKNGNEISATILTGERILSSTGALAKRQQVSTGGAIPGGTLTSPATLDDRIPKAPVITSLTSTGYWDTDGAAKSQINVVLAPVSNAISGAAIAVDYYEFWWRPTVGAPYVMRTASGTPTFNVAGWDVSQAVQVQFRARSTAGVFGEWSDFVEHTTSAPAVGLAAPDVPTVTANALGTINAAWNGLIAGAPAPAHLAHVRAEISPDGIAPWSVFGTPLVDAGSTSIDPGLYQQWFVRLVPVSRLGQDGTPSAVVSITTTAPPDIARIPKAPTGLAVTTDADWNEEGTEVVAWADMTWNPVTETFEPVDRTNRHMNPRMNAAGGSGVNRSGMASLAFVNTAGRDWLSMTTTVTTAASAYLSPHNRRMAAVLGTTFTARIRVRNPNAVPRIFSGTVWSATGSASSASLGTALSQYQSPLITIPAGGEQIFEWSATITDAASQSIHISAVRNSGIGAAIGDGLLVTDLWISTDPPPTDEDSFSGDDTDDVTVPGWVYDWTGPAYASTSERRAVSSPITIVVYEVWAKKTGDAGFTMIGTSTATSTRVTGLDPDTAYEFGVTAVSALGVRSNMSVTVSETTPDVTAALAVPTTPTLTSTRGVLRINWDGLLAGIAPPAAFRYVYAEFSETGENDWVRVGSVFMRGGGDTVIALEVGATYDVRLTAVDARGVAGTPSAIQTTTIAGVGVADLEGVLATFVTEPRIETSPEADRGVKLFSDGIVAFNAAGDPTFIVNADDGSLYFGNATISGSAIIENTIEASKINVGSLVTQLIASDLGAQLDITSNAGVNILINGAIDDAMEPVNKAFDFNADGLTIKSGDSRQALNLDNDGITMLVDNSAISWWTNEGFFVDVITVRDSANIGAHVFSGEDTVHTTVRLREV